jgi:hypothetical protein
MAAKERKERKAGRSFWSAVAERSGDTAFERTKRGGVSTRLVDAKAAWRSASRRSPKTLHLCILALKSGAIA